MLLLKQSLLVILHKRVLSSTCFKYNVTTMLSVCQHSRGLLSKGFISHFYIFLSIIWFSRCYVESADPCLSGPGFSLLECLGRMEADTQDIDLRGRGISYIPDGAFQKFTNLNLLDLSFNRIRTVSSEAFDVAELRTLKLNDNLIETLSGPITAWHTFFHSKPDAVSLGNNRLICNCSITWLVEFLVTDEFIQDAALVRCTEPAEWQNLPLRSMPETVDAACKGAVMGTSLGARYCNSPTMFPCSTPPTGTPAYPCIEQALLCDGMAHCPLNGNDENPFICNGYRRGVPKIPSDMVPFVKDSFGYFDGLLERARSQMFGAATATTKTVPEISGCRKGMFKCFSGALCVPSAKICDGSADCPDGADEEISMCTKASGSATLRPTFPSETTVQLLSAGSANQSAVTFNKMNDPRDNLTIATVGFLTKATASQTTRKPSSTTIAPSTSTMATTSIEDGLNLSLDFQRLPTRTAYLPFEQIPSLPVLATDVLAPHPTITFPQVNGVAHVNHFQNGFPQDIANYYDGELVSVKEKASTPEVAPTVLEGVVNVSSVSTEMVRLPAESFLQPVRIHIKSTANHDLVIGWDPPGSPQGNGWHLVAYSVECEILRNGLNKKKKKSPLLSTLVREYVFHHILPEDSLKLTVKALYQDTDNQRYEYTSETFLREGTDGLPVMYQNPEKEVALPSAKQVNYPGKMGFEDVLGIAVGGTLAGLMVLLIGIYVFRKRNIFLKRGGHGTNARALRMRKIDSRHHHKVNDRTLSTEPIYSEPEYALQTALDNSISVSKRMQTLRSPPHALAHPANPEDGYVQVLESESPYYNPARSRSCSEYSCYSVSAGVNPVLANSRLVPASLPSSDSSYGSFAVYDSDNCSVGYYYHNSGLSPATCTATPATTATQCLHAHNLKHFGDTLTPCHNVPVSHTLTLPIAPTRNGRSASQGKNETIG